MSKILENKQLYEKATEILRQNRQSRALATLLQRKLKIGYAKSAHILDVLEERGIVSKPEGMLRKVL